MSRFARLLKNQNSLGSLTATIDNSWLKGLSWQNIRKSDFCPQILNIHSQLPWSSELQLVGEFKIKATRRLHYKLHVQVYQSFSSL